MTWTKDNAWWLGIAIGCLIAIFISYITKKEKEPMYAIKSCNVISGFKDNNLRISYSDNNVDSFTISRIAFWNNGREPIHQRDISDVEPLRVQVENDKYRILDASIIATTKTENLFDIKIDHTQKFVIVSFDYLGKNDGAVIQILHDGEKSKDLGLKGTIKGVDKKLIPVPENPYDYRHLKLGRKLGTRYVLPLMLWAWFVGFPTIILLFYIYFSGSLCCSLAPIIILIIIVSIITLTRLERSVPKGLSEFEKEIEM